MANRLRSRARPKRHTMLELIRALEPHLDSATDFRDVIALIDDVQTPEAIEQVEALRRAFSLWFHLDAELVFPNLTDVPANVVEQWNHALAVSTHAVLRSRLGDLCWLRKINRPHEAARAAITGYLSLSDIWDGVAGYACVSRALNLARAVGEADSVKRIYELAEQRAKEYLPVTGGPDISSLRYLQLLVAAPVRERRPGLAELLQRARVLFDHDPYHVHTIIELQQQLVGDDHAARRELQRQLARRWGLAAERDHGMAKLFHLQTALEAARNEPEVRADLLRQQREINLATLGFQRLGIEVPIDDVRVDCARRALFSAVTWKEVLNLLIMRLRPAGEHEANRDEAANAAAASAVDVILRALVLDPETRQARPIEDYDQRVDQELGTIERRNVDMNAGLFIRPALRYLPIRFSPDPAELLEWLTDNGSSPLAVARVVRDALYRWWDRDDTLGATTTFTTALEALIRHRASLHKITVTTLATAQQRGGYRGMGDLLADLRGHVDESWRRFLRCALVSDTGFNLRNRLFHGILLEPNEQDVAVLAMAALYLSRIPAPAGREGSSPGDG